MKTRQSSQFIETWNAPEHVLEAGFVRLIIGNVFYRRGTDRSLFYEAREFFDRYLMVVSHVDDLTNRFVRCDQAQKRFHGIPHVAKAARLLPRSVNGNRRALQGLPNKIGKNHAVPSGLPGSDGVEEPGNDYGQPFLFPIRKRKELVQSLRCGITPAALGGRAKHQVGVFMKRDIGIFSVHLGSGSDKNQLALPASSFQ